MLLYNVKVALTQLHAHSTLWQTRSLINVRSAALIVHLALFVHNVMHQVDTYYLEHNVDVMMVTQSLFKHVKVYYIKKNIKIVIIHV